MDIRYYTPEDDPALMSLERLSPRGLPEPFVHYRRRFIDRVAVFADHQLLVAEEDGRVTGCVAVSVKHTQVGGRPVSLGYIFDVRTLPVLRRQGVGTALVKAVEAYLAGLKADGVYGHILSSNVASLRLFDRLDYARLRQLILLTYQPSPALDLPEVMPRHTHDHTAEQDLIRAVHSSRDLYVPDVAERVKDFGFERWSIDLGAARFAGMSLFDQSYVFQQWPASEPFLSEEDMRRLGKKSLRLFDEVGIHNARLLKTIFDSLRDLAVSNNVSKLTLLLDRQDRVPVFFYADALGQLDYWMVFKSLNPEWNPDWQDAPIYVDSREL